MTTTPTPSQSANDAISQLLCIKTELYSLATKKTKHSFINALRKHFNPTRQQILTSLAKNNFSLPSSISLNKHSRLGRKIKDYKQKLKELEKSINNTNFQNLPISNPAPQQQTTSIFNELFSLAIKGDNTALLEELTINSNNITDYILQNNLTNTDQQSSKLKDPTILLKQQQLLQYLQNNPSLLEEEKLLSLCIQIAQQSKNTDFLIQFGSMKDIETYTEQLNNKNDVLSVICYISKTHKDNPQPMAFCINYALENNRRPAKV